MSNPFCLAQPWPWLSLWIAAALPCIALAQVPAAGTAQYPTKPLRMVVGFAGGGAAEIAARIVGQVYSERFGQQVIIDPRPGAGGNHRQRTRRQSAAGRLHLAYLRVCIHR